MFGDPDPNHNVPQKKKKNNNHTLMITDNDKDYLETYSSRCNFCDWLIRYCYHHSYNYGHLHQPHQYSHSYAITVIINGHISN